MLYFAWLKCARVNRLAFARRRLLVPSTLTGRATALRNPLSGQRNTTRGRRRIARCAESWSRKTRNCAKRRRKNETKKFGYVSRFLSSASVLLVVNHWL